MPDKGIPVFIIEDDPVYMEMISDFIRDRFRRLEVHRFQTGEQAIAALSEKPAIVVLDYFLNRQNDKVMNGFDVLVEVATKLPKSKIIILSAQDNIDVSVHMMKYGAYDYIVKSEAAVYRLQNILNHIMTMIDYDRRIYMSRLALTGVGVMLAAVLTYILLS